MCQEIHLADIRTALVDFYELEAASDHGQAGAILGADSLPGGLVAGAALGPSVRRLN